MKAQYILTLCLAVAALSSCDKFLDTMPDNRTEIDTPEKAKSLVGDAYAGHSFTVVAEFTGDNLDNCRATISSDLNRSDQNNWNWRDNDESNNDSQDQIWTSNWSAISNANQALEAIEKMGGKENPELAETYGEALLARAWAHFSLVNIFCKAYNDETSSPDPGLPYMDKPEVGLSPSYERGTVADVYAHIAEDIEEGLKYVGNNYDVPKYHFTPIAGHAFAARFYLYYGKWDKVIEHASQVLGDNPRSMLRDYEALQTNYPVMADQKHAYNSPSEVANLLLQTGYGQGPQFWGTDSGAYKHFAFTTYIAETESYMAPTPWINRALTPNDFIWTPHRHYSGALSWWSLWKMAYYFEYSDPVAGTGMKRNVIATLTTEMVLLDRAEAYIHQQQYDKALEDMTLWVNHLYKGTYTLTLPMISSFYDAMPYYEWYKPTQKKRLEPRMPIEIYDSDNENMLHCILNMRRTEQMALGLRWFDVKRYGITIYRRELDSDGNVWKVTDEMLPDDDARAIQIPYKAIDGGFPANPRSYGYGVLARDEYAASRGFPKYIGDYIN